MKKKFVMVFCLIPIFLGVRQVWSQDPFEDVITSWEEFSNNSDINYGLEAIDTMTINEIIFIRNLLAGNIYRQECEIDISEAKADFIISRSPSNIAGLNYGIYWPTGTLVKLPRSYVKGTPRIDKQNGSLFIYWYERLDTAVYDSYISSLLPLKKIKKGRVIIYPLCY